MTAVWRPMDVGDVPAVERIAAMVHADYPEATAVFAERLSLFPAGCRIAASAGEVLGYAIMHPGLLGEPPPLDTLLGGLPPCADCLYMHDVALVPAARGTGLGEAAVVIARAVAVAAGLPVLALTATPPAHGYWRRLGFADWPADPALEARLAIYGPGMTYMTAPAG